MHDWNLALHDLDHATMEDAEGQGQSTIL